MNASPPRPEPVTVRSAGLVAAELRKLKRSLVVPLSLAVPGLVLLFAFLAKFADATASANFLIALAGIWSYAMLPLGIVALTVVLAQLEHGPRGWDPLLALPGVRQRIFLIKLGAAFVTMAIWHAILWVGGVALAFLFAATDPAFATAPEQAGVFAHILARMTLASLLMLVVQYGVALYFRSFVPPLLIGVGGIFLSVAATASRQGAYLPWLLATNQLASSSARADATLAFGLGGGIVAALILQWLMARREW
ncbi:ABC transporter permease [Sphingomicrobium arenosum]|uniref:ABC transporter permease n=1 Tax=Sphingomicrobium arenosum TaxID=2233861 RepID=UPI0022402AF3|nr:ABC transporter permease [Sphingomicrobium arenosum]